MALTEAQIKALLGDAYVAPEEEEFKLREKEAEGQVAAEAEKRLFENESRVVKQEGLRLIMENVERGADVPPAELLRQARTNVEAQFGQPLTPGFEKEQLPRLFPDAAAPGERAPLRPQIRTGSAAQRKFELERLAEVAEGRELLALDVEKVQSLGPDEQVQAYANYAGVSAAWKKLAEENPQASGEQLNELLEDALSTLQETMQGKGERLRHILRPGGPASAVSRAFKPQMFSAEFPNLSDAQIEFLVAASNEQAERSRPATLAEVRKTYRVDVPATAEFGVEQPTRAPTEEEVQEEFEKRVAAQKELPWWATPEKEQIISNLEEHAKGLPGLKRTYPTGAVVEGPVHYLFRAALTVPNAATAAAFSGLEAVGARPGVAKARAERPELYQEPGIINDVAFNVARNRSAMEEIGEMYKYTAGLEKYQAVGYLAGFAADLLVPIDLGAAELARAGKTTYNVSRLNKSLYGASDWAQAMKLGGKQLLGDIPVLRNAVKNPGDFRLFMGAETGRSLLGYKVFQNAIEQGDDFEKALAKAAKNIGEESSFVAQARKLGGADEVLEQFGKQEILSRYADEVEDAYRQIAGHVARTKNIALSGKDAMRWIKTIARRSQHVEDLLKGKKGLRKMLETIWNDKTARSILQKQIAWEKGMEAVAESTAGWRNIAKNLVMVTPRTWANADVLPDILKEAGKGATGRLRDALKDLGISREVIRGVGEQAHLHKNYVAQGWKLSDKSKDVAGEVMQLMQHRYVNTGYLKSGEASRIFNELAQDFLSTDSMRKLINAEIDLTAQAMRRGLTQKAAQQLSAEVRKEILQPIESRSFTSGWFQRNIVQRIFGTPVAEKELSLLAQQELTNLKRQISSMDKKLRTDVKRLQTDAAFRELYGVPEGMKLSDEDAMIRLLLGESTIPGRQWGRNQQLYQTVMDFYVLYLKKTPSLGDVYRADVFVEANTFLSKEGQGAIQEFLDGKIVRSTGDIVPGGNDLVKTLLPQNFKQYMNEFIDFVNKGLKENPSWRVEGLRAEGELSFVGEKHLGEMMASVYYQTEARRAVDASIARIMEADAGNVGAKFLESFENPQWFQRLGEEIGLTRGVTQLEMEVGDVIQLMDAPMTRLLIQRGREKIAEVAESGSTSLTRGLPADINAEWESVIRALSPAVTDAQVQAVLANKHHRIATAILVGEVDDTIYEIVRRNGLIHDNVARDLDVMEQAIKKARTGAERAELRGLEAEAAVAKAERTISDKTANAAGRMNELRKQISEGSKSVTRMQESLQREIKNIEKGLAESFESNTAQATRERMFKELRNARAELKQMAKLRLEILRDIKRIPPSDIRRLPEAMEADEFIAAPSRIAGQRIRGHEMVDNMQKEVDAMAGDMSELGSIIRITRQMLEQWVGAGRVMEAKKFRELVETASRKKAQVERLSEAFLKRGEGSVRQLVDELQALENTLKPAQAKVAQARQGLTQAQQRLDLALETEAKLPIREAAGKRSMKSALEELAFGRNNTAVLEDCVTNARQIENLRSYMKGLHETTSGNKALKYFGLFVRRLNAARYNLILGYRPRFHGTNQITAPTIILGTLGGEAAVKGVINWVPAVDVMATGLLRPGSVRASRIAVTDAAGRAWTYDDLFSMALEGGAMRSRHSFQVNEAMIDGAVQQAKLEIKNPKLRAQVINDIKNKGSIPLELAEVEDNIWRMSIIMDSLRKGEDIGVALEKGRVSMFDYGKMTDGERWAATRLFMFYTFTRSSVVHSFNNLVSNPNRMKNALVLKRDTTKLMTGEDAEDLMFYAPDWAVSRPIIKFTNGVEKESFYTLGPSIVPVESTALVLQAFADATRLDAAAILEPLANLLTPEIKLALGEDKFLEHMKKGHIDARDVAWLKVTGAWVPFSAYVGETPIGVEAKVGESTYGGKRWTLSNQGWERYMSLKKASSFIGISTIANDYAQAYGTIAKQAEGRQLTLGEDAITGGFEFIGGITEVGGITPEEAQRFSTSERAFELQEIEQRRK